MSTTETTAVPAGTFGRTELPLGDAGLGDAVIDWPSSSSEPVPFKPGVNR
jgi:hypothetical protein